MRSSRKLTNDSACGKSSLTIRLTDDRFSDTHDVTIAAEIGSKVLPVGDDSKMKLQIWDTAGQEHFRAVTRSYFRNAAGCILVYDITRRGTFDNVQQWLDDIRDQSDSDISICLVGNKQDLEAQREVSFEEARKWADDNNISKFVETSAKTGDKVVEAYHGVAQEIYQKIKDGKYDLTKKSNGIKAKSNGNGLINLNMDTQGERSKPSRCC